MVFMENIRETHSNSLNFEKYRKNDNINHPQARLELREKDFVERYYELFFVL